MKLTLLPFRLYKTHKCPHRRHPINIVYQLYIVDMSLMYYHWIICPGTCTLHFAMIAVSNGENIICTHLYLIQYISYIKRNISSIIQTVGSVNEYIWSRIVDRKTEVVEISLAVNEKSAD